MSKSNVKSKNQRFVYKEESVHNSFHGPLSYKVTSETRKMAEEEGDTTMSKAAIKEETKS